jgi:pSer/pThr/pTyr-binding forkhead associated (FHA) protein
MARLVIFDEAVRVVDLPAHPVILGRSRKADIPIADFLLSRKHCSILPSPSGFRLMDLKSSNGTFLNGVRVDKSDLTFDDIIEMGNTVIVLLDTDTWKRGEGLTRLRNPVKAQEMIQAIKKRTVFDRPQKPPGSPGKSGIKDRSGRSGTAAQVPDGDFTAWASRSLLEQPVVRELLENYLAHHLVSVLSRKLPELESLIASAKERLLTRGVLEGDWDHLRDEVRKVVGDLLSSGGPSCEQRAIEDGGPDEGGGPVGDSKDRG